MSDAVPQTDAHPALALLDEGIRAATAFAEALRAELEALEREDPDALLAAAEAKRAQLAELEALERRRQQLLADAGRVDDKDGMQALIEAVDADGALARKWRRYLKLADECQRANLTNGAIIRLRQGQVTSALAVLAGAESQTYGPGGAERPAASRQLAEA